MALESVRLAAGNVFSQRGYVLLAAAFSLLSMLVYVSIPVLTVPGNSYDFFLASTAPADLAVMALLSILMGIVLAMQAYCWKNRIRAVTNAGVGIAGFLSGAVSAIFASATCTSCVSALFSFIGFGGVLFLLEHKAEVTAFTGGLVLLSLYFTSERIAGHCSSCRIMEGKG